MRAYHHQQTPYYVLHHSPVIYKISKVSNNNKISVTSSSAAATLGGINHSRAVCLITAAPSIVRKILLHLKNLQFFPQFSSTSLIKLIEETSYGIISVVHSHLWWRGIMNRYYYYIAKDISSNLENFVVQPKHNKSRSQKLHMLF